MKASSRAFISTLMMLLFLAGCETSHNTPSPAKNYFLKYYGEDGFQTGVDVEYNPADQSFILLGTTGKSTNDKDTTVRLFLVKADALGNIIHKVAFGGDLGNQARDVAITSDGNIIVLANEFKADGNRQILVERFDQSLTPIDKSFIQLKDENGADANDDGDGISLTELSDGGFMIAGYANDLAKNPGQFPNQYDGIHVRLTNSLALYKPSVWKSGVGGSNKGVITKVIQVSNDSFFSFGYSTDNNNDTDYRVIPFDLNGEPVNGSLTIGSPTANELLGAAVLSTSATSGTNYFVAGISTKPDNSSDLYLASLGNSRNVGGDTVPALNQTPASLGFSLRTPNQSQASIGLSASSGFLILCNEATSGNSNWLLTKVSNTLQLTWSTAQVYGGDGDDYSGAVKELPDGKIIMVGTMSLNGETKMTLVKVNKDGLFAD